ncbi:hypothetical protein H5410_006539 [Solanum commersonii]|uniref:Uncharacterized protein n=1 Tax=Solanum commersonii TaxID=4109 RepID=A0A9J6AA17_SOLCO|nr:hypothetical protein H5410_006539 [Solanum commersonii]
MRYKILYPDSEIPPDKQRLEQLVALKLRLDKMKKYKNHSEYTANAHQSSDQNSPCNASQHPRIVIAVICVNTIASPRNLNASLLWLEVLLGFYIRHQMPFQGHNVMIQIWLSRYEDQHSLTLCCVTEDQAKGIKLNTEVNFLSELTGVTLHTITLGHGTKNKKLGNAAAQQSHWQLKEFKLHQSAW